MRSRVGIPARSASGWRLWCRYGRVVLTAVAALAVGLAGLSAAAESVTFGTDAYVLDDSGRIVFWLPLEWAANPYAQDSEFPVDTDSLTGVITYWIPNPLEASVTWRSGSGTPLWGDEWWWRRWAHPLDFSVDGEYAETGARPVPVSLLVYATCLPAMAAWVPWKRRRAVGKDRGGSGRTPNSDSLQAV